MKKALPVMLMDASFLIQLGKAETAINYNMDSDYDALSQPQLTEILQKFVNEGRTIMLTRKVMSEIFPTAAGRLDYVAGADGKPEFPLGISQEQFRFPESMLAHNLFSDFAQKGQLRCYESVDAMLNAEEITQPRGGIVVVDTAPAEKRRPTQENGMRLSPNRDYFDVMHNADEIAAKNARATAKHHGRGDNTMVNLGMAIAQNAYEHGQNGSFLVASNDNDLASRFLNMARGNFVPVVCRPHELLWAMEQHRPDGKPALEEGVAARYSNAVQYLKMQSGHPLVVNMGAFLRSVDRTKYWLQDTTRDTGPSAPVVGKHTADYAAQAKNTHGPAK